jgi:hypothetical protein
MTEKKMDLLDEKINTILKKASEAEQRIAIFSSTLNDNTNPSKKILGEYKKLESNNKALLAKNIEVLNASQANEKQNQNLLNQLEIAEYKVNFISDELINFKNDNKLISKELNELKDELIEKNFEYKANISEVNFNHEKDLEVSKNKYEKDLEVLKDSNEKELEITKNKYEKDLEVLKDSNEKELEITKNKYEKDLEVLKDKGEEDLQFLNNKWNKLNNDTLRRNKIDNDN